MCLPVLSLTRGDNDSSATSDPGATIPNYTSDATTGCPAMTVPACGPYQELRTVQEPAGSCPKLVCGEF